MQRDKMKKEDKTIVTMMVADPVEPLTPSHVQVRGLRHRELRLFA